MWPSNSSRGDGLNLRIRDAAAPDGSPILTFLSFSPIPLPNGFALPGILRGALWIGPAPLLQTGFGAVTTVGGVANCAPPILGRNRLRGLRGPIWDWVIVGRGGLPFPSSNAAATLLSATN
jgi:hypothetical protein